MPATASQILVLVLIMIDNIITLVFDPGYTFPYTTGNEPTEESGHTETPVECIDAPFSLQGFHDVICRLSLGHQHRIVLVRIQDIRRNEARADVRKPDRNIFHPGKLGKGGEVGALVPSATTPATDVMTAMCAFWT